MHIVCVWLCVCVDEGGVERSQESNLQVRATAVSAASFLPAWPGPVPGRRWNECAVHIVCVVVVVCVCVDEGGVERSQESNKQVRATASRLPSGLA